MMKLTRRQFNRFFAALGIGAGSGRNLIAQTSSDEDEKSEENCNINIVKTETAIAVDDEKCLFWIDGLYIDKSQIRPRANLAFLLKFPQTPDHFIDKVVFADGDKNTLGVRYFEPQDKLSSGYPPYLIFNNVDLSKSNRFYLVFQVKHNNEIIVYRKTLSSFDLRRSRLDHQELPAKLRFDLDASHQGIISNILQFRANLTRKSVKQHIIRSQILQLSNDNHFTIQIAFFHEDESPDHYNRYFIVTDPVGRILGLVKREFGDAQKEFVMVSALTENERTQWGLTRDKVARINDCPYIMIFADDVKESLSGSTIWLR